MVTILPPKTNLGSQIGQAIANNRGLSDFLDQQLRQKHQQDNLRLQSQLKSEQEKAQGEQSQVAEEENYKTIEKAFGKKFADVWKASNQGSRTELTKAGLEQRHRRKDVNELLTDLQEQDGQNQIQQGNQGAANPNQNGPQIKPIPGLTPKEEAAYGLEAYKSKKELNNKLSFPILEESNNVQQTLNARQSNITLGKNAIKEGNVSGLDQDYLADIFHFAPLKTAKGAQLKSAIKDLFVKDIQAVGARPNQWIEQQIGSATPEIGKSAAANNTLFDIAQFRLDLDKNKVQMTSKLRDRYLDELGYIPARIGDEVNERMQPYIEKRQNELAYDLRKNYESDKSFEDLAKFKPVPTGTPLTRKMAKILLEHNDNDPRKAEQDAMKRGFIIPSDEMWREKDS